MFENHFFSSTQKYILIIIVTVGKQFEQIKWLVRHYNYKYTLLLILILSAFHWKFNSFQDMKGHCKFSVPTLLHCPNFIIALLGCNWHTIYCIYLTCTIWCFNVCIYLGNHHQNQENKHIHHPQKFPGNPFLISPFHLSLPCPHTTLICFLLLYISLYYHEFYKNGIMHYILHFIQLLWLSTIKIHSCCCTYQ